MVVLRWMVEGKKTEGVQEWLGGRRWKKSEGRRNDVTVLWQEQQYPSSTLETECCGVMCLQIPPPPPSSQCQRQGGNSQIGYTEKWCCIRKMVIKLRPIACFLSVGRKTVWKINLSLLRNLWFEIRALFWGLNFNKPSGGWIELNIQYFSDFIPGLMKFMNELYQNKMNIP